MQTYLQFEIKGLDPEQASIVIALLSDSGFSGFEEEGETLKAFIPSPEYSEGTIEALAEQFDFVFTRRGIEETNWNQLWESNFEPVLVDDFLLIRAAFHEPRPADMEIIITPKMSFGTGHHATTYMMVAQMRTLDFNRKRVFDFGTGTGVLAILAEKMGAADILAIDNDEWSIRNAAENCQVNNCKNIRLEQAEGPGKEKDFDIILANINLYVIEANLANMFSVLKPGGYILLSGLLSSDKAAVLKQTAAVYLRTILVMEKDNWMSVMLLR